MLQSLTVMLWVGYYYAAFTGSEQTVTAASCTPVVTTADSGDEVSNTADDASCTQVVTTADSGDEVSGAADALVESEASGSEDSSGYDSSDEQGSDDSSDERGTSDDTSDECQWCTCGGERTQSLLSSKSTQCW